MTAAAVSVHPTIGMAVDIPVNRDALFTAAPVIDVANLAPVDMPVFNPNPSWLDIKLPERSVALWAVFTADDTIGAIALAPRIVPAARPPAPTKLEVLPIIPPPDILPSG